MSSRRKSSVPCMVRVNADPLRDQEGMEVELLEDSDESAESSDASQRMNPEDPGQQNQVGDPDPKSLEVLDQRDEQEPPPVREDVEAEAEHGEGSVSGSAFQTKRTRSFTCKYCPFSSPNLSRFKEHVDSEHPNVILNPRYLCTVCNFSTNKFDSLTVHNLVRHPGETNFKFKRLKTKHQTVLEQTVEGPDGSVKDEESTERLGAGSVFPATVKTPESLQALYKQQEVSQLDHLVQKDQITAVTINGTVIIPEPAFLRGLSHVAPLLQRPPNFQSVPKVAVPLNTTKYNPSLDHNATLITSFNRFPYPTHAELSWLTAASKHPEEQIRIWFTTQRLKQGITWSPEEVEEARKKMFNGSVPPAHHAFAVLPAAHESSQQPLGPTVRQPTTTPTPLVAGGASSAHKRAHLTTIFGPEPKRPVMAVAPHSADDKILMAPPPPPPPPQKERLPMALPPVPMETKRLPAAVPLTPSPSLPSKGKLPSVLGNAKTKPVVSLPSMVFPESLTTPMIAPPPFAAPPFKNSLLIPLSSTIASKELHPNKHGAADLKLPTSPPPGQETPHHSLHPRSAQSRLPDSLFPPGAALNELQGIDPKASYSRREAPAEANGASDCKWPGDLSSPAPNNGITECGVPKADLQQKSSVLTQFPLLERMKGKTAEQLKVLEEYFLRNSFPSQGDVDHLAGSAQLSPQEIGSWFVERRALRDNLEQALLSSMGAKRAAPGGLKMKQQLNGTHKPGAVAPPPPRPRCSWTRQPFRHQPKFLLSASRLPVSDAPQGQFSSESVAFP
ncbi:LOW QUALITY PROTEIN: zinc fingers and homeoboxes protein 2-like [Takifugu rubripes]|uniref:LOW QUALITY PROTEIN: zinc fingers and homeoboxes protein 2-like n=1 Tax=Takifugu rubripes TaxID=31033 RepID=UPI0011453ABD|nr:LOW QUALITY PROTEIN: zinc fingers and homeoboxes protein 2-like [Takifugu rubripes]